MAKKNNVQLDAVHHWVVGNVCSFMHKGKHYTEGMEITAAAFPKEELFNAAIKQGKIVPMVLDENTENVEQPVENTGTENEPVEDAK